LTRAAIPGSFGVSICKPLYLSAGATRVSDHSPINRFDGLNPPSDPEDRDPARLQQHVADVYAAPLEAYYRSTTWFRDLGHLEDWKPDSIVQAFMAERVMRPGYFQQWQNSGKRLRAWLVNGLHFMLREHYRAWKRHARTGARVVEPAFEPEPGQAADQLILKEMVRLSVLETVKTLRAEGKFDHVRAFVHVDYRGHPIGQAADRLGCTPGVIKGRLRVARKRFGRCFRRILHRDGTPPGRVEDEIRTILEIIHGPRDPT